MDWSVLGLDHELQVSHSPLHEALSQRSPTPQSGISSTQREKGRPCRWPVHADTHRYPIGSHHSSVWCSSPHDLSLSCASLHIFPTSQPRSLVISTLWISHLHALLMLVPPPRKPPSPLLVTFSPSLLSKPYLSIWLSNPLTSFVLPSHSSLSKAMRSTQASTPPQMGRSGQDHAHLPDFI